MPRTLLSAALVALSVAAIFSAPALRAQAPDSATAILQVLADQQNAWNQGDIVTFMHGYNDAPDTTFIGKSVEHGYQPILARYQRIYATRDAMGILKFSDASVHMLGPGHAVVVGQFHLSRSAAGGGDAQGIFSLIFEKEPSGWKIILDHTSAT
jgi:ketosteroid isomerase-like protein